MAASNAARFRREIGRLASGDAEGFFDYLSPEAVVHVPGTKAIAGTYRGRQEFAGLLGRILEVSGGTFRIEPAEILAGDRC
ncbi:MAG: nuclear transport factor 2 family protein [Actinomycetota bacterium]